MLRLLKRRVLDLAIKQINDNTDLTASYEQHKQGQKIKGFTFKFKCKPTQKPTEQLEQRDPHTLDMFVPMTDNQRFAFAKKNLSSSRGFPLGERASKCQL